ncbi:L,D-transpeptidase family protein [Terrimonas pollutisoli]|uniref:L,D-transpeptidase family protein n=1 Tax=Terrimonas pollutisoli TaxID=3034147 RepID=UPI0023EC3085|nr:L,D-transpeptidase family protein [Terrimonas sp. H1YJ31]
MVKKVLLYSLFLCSFFCCIVIACNNDKRPPVTEIAKTPEELEKKIPDIIQSSLAFALSNNGKIDDSIRLSYTPQVQLVYEKSKFASVWSSKESWEPLADSMFRFIRDAKLFGLFPQDYHHDDLDSLNKKLLTDTLAKKDVVLWAKADLMLSDAFIHIVKDLKLGRLPKDSMTQRKDTTLIDDFYLQQFEQAQQSRSITNIFEALEPAHEGYVNLKEGIKGFLDSADNRVYTIVPSPKKDSINYPVLLQRRLYEGGFIAYDSIKADSASLADAVKKFQRSKKITVDGKAGEGTLRLLNESDRDKFIRIAITLDRYKKLPEKMPERYLWVNLPAFNLKLIENDTVLISSKIICGKNITRTPLLTSAISDMITYPQWTIPTSIIVKEILPGLKKDTNYLARKGYTLIDNNGDIINPADVNWSKYTKGIPYKVVQGSGDENALGILKFNFPNKYAVYLHDTNQRYLFSREMRSLSHGCVRVQEWEELAYYIVRYDNKDLYFDEPSPTEDSLTAWLERKEKHVIPVKKRLPLYIRYFTCEGKEGKLVFYDDIYGEDKALQAKYFAGR